MLVIPSLLAMASWSRAFLSEFIVEFRELQSLWNTKSKEYHDRELKKQSYCKLLEKVRTVDPNAQRDTILRKINVIRCSFRKEYKKVLASKKSGSKNEYIPKLWYYKDLLFLLGQGESGEGSSCMDDESEPEDVMKSERISCSVPAISCPQPDSAMKLQPEFKPKNLEYLSTNNHNYFASANAASRREKLSSTGDTLQGSNRSLDVIEDRFDVFGKYVAAKLRALEQDDQRIFAEKVINEALFEAELGGLTRYCSVNAGSFAQNNYAAPHYSSNEDLRQ